MKVTARSRRAGLQALFRRAFRRFFDAQDSEMPVKSGVLRPCCVKTSKNQGFWGILLLLSRSRFPYD
jgi:hypothetical protein